MIKKAAAVCLAAAVSAFSLPCVTAFAQPAAAESAYFLWFKDQLNETAGKFYTAMENMQTTGVFAQGDALYDVTDLVGQSALAGYAQGNTQLLYDMGAARDAFAADHPELFYVDFSQLTLRVTSADGKYYATLGAGRSATYFAEGIDAATLNQKIALLNEKVEEIASGVPDGSDRQKATYVHDKIVNDLCDYARETQAKEENAAFVHSAYGALVCGESVCEGYAKSYKLVMDTLHIPCVTVQGLYESPTSGGVQEHMWNCVQIDDVWYAVDATMDDPKGYAPTHEYLLCDASAMADTHFADGVMSEANFEFTYPAVQNVTMQSGEGDSRFTVTTGNRQQSGDVISYDIAVSFNGMGCAAAAEAGYYFLIDYDQSDNWGYIIPSLYGGGIKDESDVMTFTVSNNVDSVQFAVTEEPLPDQSNGPDLYFKGDASTLVKSGVIAPTFGEKYYAPPYVYSVTPSNQSAITPDREYEVVITYTKDLKKTGEVKVNLSSTNQIATNTSKVTNVSWDDSRPRELRFLFQPSATYGGDACLYTFDIEGLVGTDSGKKPMGVSLYAKHTAFYGCPHADGWQVFGKPALIANGDMSANGWEYADGSKVADDVSFRIALIASQPADRTKYEDAVKDLGVSPVSSQTYNLTLNLCDKQVSQLADGQRMKIMLPYPDGYDPALAGTTFKAYHFDKDGKPERLNAS